MFLLKMIRWEGCLVKLKLLFKKLLCLSLTGRRILLLRALKIIKKYTKRLENSLTHPLIMISGDTNILESSNLWKCIIRVQGRNNLSLEVLVKWLTQLRMDSSLQDTQEARVREVWEHFRKPKMQNFREYHSYVNLRWVLKCILKVAVMDFKSREKWDGLNVMDCQSQPITSTYFQNTK
jgi:hypothetical protein